MTRVKWSAALNACVLVKLGQELGTDSPAARAIHDLLDFLATFAAALTP